jgi:hypothetical protein
LVVFLVGGGFCLVWAGGGGWAYQTLAIALTYIAVAVTYIPFIVKEAINQTSVSSTSVLDSAGVPTRQTAQSAPTAPSKNASRSGSRERGAGGSKSGSPLPTPRRQGDMNPFVALAVLLLLFAAAPVLVGFSSIIHILILGFALFEAWRLNKRVRVTFTGPHRVGAVRPASA